MLKLSHRGRYLFCGFLLGFTLAIWGGQWTWLAMRINTAYFIPLGVLLGLFLSRRRKRLSVSWVVGLQVLWFASFYSGYSSQWEALTALPAILFKQGFGLDFLSLNQANWVLVVVLILGNICGINSCLYLCERCNCDKEEESCAN